VTAPAACEDGYADIFPCAGVDLEAWVENGDMPGAPSLTNDLWGWTDGAGKEWALVGLDAGTAFMALDDGAVRGVLPTATEDTVYRDIKTFGDYAYVVADDAGDHGLQVFDLARLAAEDPDGDGFYAADAVYDGFGSAHNLVVDAESATAFAVGSDTCGGGLHALDLADPGAPVFAGCAWEADYVHDAQCVVYRGPDADHYGRAVCVLFAEEEVRIVDVSDLASPVELAALAYEGVSYAHQGWLTCAQDTLLVDDELDEYFGEAAKTRTFVVDVSDLDAPAVVGVHEAATASIDHNQYVCGAHTYQANYEAGLRVLEIADDGALAEVAFFDTYLFRSVKICLRSPLSRSE
jgi:choice-of-anchor B domain-containing protein